MTRLPKRLGASLRRVPDTANLGAYAEDVERWILLGTVHPANGRWFFASPIPVAVAGLVGVVVVNDSQFIMTLEGPAGGDPANIFGAAQEQIQFQVDVLGYELGATLTAEVDRATVEGKGVAPVLLRLQYEWPELTGRSPGTPVAGADLAHIAAATGRSPHLRAALADLGLARSRALDTSFYCARAIESVRHWLAVSAEAELTESEAWQRLRDALGVSESELRLVTNAARGSRHGDHTSVTAEERLEYLRISRLVFQRAVDLASTQDSVPDMPQ